LHIIEGEYEFRSGSPDVEQKTNLNSRLYSVILVCLVAALSYLTARLGGSLVLRPQMLWALWPGCALLVAVLLLTPRKLWPILLAAGLAGFVLFDAQAGLALRPTVILIVSDVVEILIAVFGVSYFFSGPVRLNSIRSLMRYSLFAVVLAPLAAAFIATAAFSGDYWIRWRIGFFTEALALLTLTPAILSWASVGQTCAQKPRAFFLEAIALIAGLGVLGYVAFAAPKQISSPVLLYSLLPILLWAALRFGLAGITTSMILVALLSIWGAVHGRGPFTTSEPLTNVMSLQLFLFFTTATFMILAVLMEEQKRTERAFRESEKRFRLMADTAPALIWMAGPDKLCTYFNKPWLDFTGQSIDSELGNGWTAGVHPDDLQRCVDTYTRSFDGREEFRMEYRLRRYDGEYRWIVDIGVPRFDQDRSFIGYIGIGIEMTERKRAEEALTNVNRRLIEAQEKERTRIGRDLHDDIGQRLSLLTVELEQLHHDPPNLPQVRYRIGELHKQASEIATDIQSLSHELHSAKLQYLGIVTTMRGFCREFGQQQKVEVDFKTHDLADDVPPDISLCLFRVLQEALHNSAKHSRARHFEVRLWGTSDEVRLTVTDSGVGFDREAARQGRGLGLISMEERLKLLNGTLAIETQPEKGTAVHVSVPLSPGTDSMRAVG
jgi:PAS domain S-box-containing protein